MAVKLQFGSGENILDGWQNLQENQADISKHLYFEDDSVDFILCEHCLEHVDPHAGYKFLRECYRILRHGGVARIIVPDIRKVWIHADDSYRAFIKDGIKTWWPRIGWTPRPDHTPSDRELVETLIFCHGHKSVYTVVLLETLMETAGFDVENPEYGKSKHPDLNGVDGHWKMMGLGNCVLESVVVEGTKPV